MQLLQQVKMLHMDDGKINSYRPNRNVHFLSYTYNSSKKHHFTSQILRLSSNPFCFCLELCNDALVLTAKSTKDL